MDNVTLEVAKFISSAILALAGSIKVLGDRQAKANARIERKLAEMDKRTAENDARITENVQRLREKNEQDRLDFKERLAEITDYYMNRRQR